MKKNFLLLCGLACSLLLVASCDREDTEWKSIPSEQIHAGTENVRFTVNGEETESGGVQVKTVSGSEAVVTLNGIVPGYETITVKAGLSKTSESGVYALKGSAIMPEGPSIILKTKTSPLIGVYEIKVEGTVSIEGAADVRIVSSLTELGKGTLEGSWKVNRIASAVDGAPVTGPLWFEWTFAESSVYAGMSEYAKAAAAMLGVVYADYLDQINLLSDGNVTVNFWDGDIDSALPELDEEGKNYIYGNSHDDVWAETDADNEVFWFTRDGYLYLVPNADALVDDDEAVSLDDLTEVMTALQSMDVDVVALIAELQKIQKNGVAFKYDQQGDALKIYVDKGMCDPVINAFIPALPYVDAYFNAMKDSEDESEKAMYNEIKVYLAMMGMENPSDFAKLWKDTTGFRIELNFTK